MKYKEITNMSYPEFIEIINDFNDLALDKIKRGQMIFRGMSEELDHMVVKPRQRRSAYTSRSFYHWFLSNDPSWEKFPPRSISHISTTSMDKARQYGYVYLIIPKKDQPIGVCPESDIWFSFPELKKWRISNLQDFNFWLAQVFNDAKGYGLNVDPGTADQSYDRLMAALQLIQDSNVVDRLMSIPPFDGHNLIAEIRQALNPERNGFTCVDYRNFDITPSIEGQEVWFTGDALIIHYDQYLSFIKQLQEGA